MQFSLAFAIFAYLTLMVASSRIPWAVGTFYSNDVVPSTNCSFDGQLIGNGKTITEHSICLPNRYGGWISSRGRCPPGGIFLPDPLHPGCVAKTISTRLNRRAQHCEETVETTVPTPVSLLCPSGQGSYACPSDCTKYYTCIEVDIWYIFIYDCKSKGTHFDPVNKVCTAVGQCSTEPEPTTAVAPTVAPTTSSSIVLCAREGSFPVPGDCRAYSTCFLYESAWYQFDYVCPPNTYYNAESQLCRPGRCPVENITPTSYTFTNRSPGLQNPCFDFSI